MQRAGRPAHGAIIFDSLDAATPQTRDLYQRCVALCGADAADVVEVRVGEALSEVDMINFDDPDWPQRTLSRRL
jgi:hypothetical protein